MLRLFSLRLVRFDWLSQLLHIVAEHMDNIILVACIALFGC